MMKGTIMDRVHNPALASTCAALLVLALALGACSGNGNRTMPGMAVSDGQQVFATYCAPCHSSSSEQKLGPGLAGLFATGGPELPAGVDYGGRLPNGDEINEANVANWIRQGGKGQIGQMPGIALNEQQMAALLTYLKELEP